MHKFDEHSSRKAIWLGYSCLVAHSNLANDMFKTRDKLQ